jgi:hypothetical protein
MSAFSFIGGERDDAALVELDLFQVADAVFDRVLHRLEADRQAFDDRAFISR